MKKILLLMTMVLTCVGTWAQTPVVHVSNIGTAPFQLSDEDAAKIFELDNLTVVLDVTTAESLSGRGAFFCVADPAQPVPSSFSGNNTSYMACGHNGSAIAYLAAAKDGQHFSTGTIPANSTIRIAYVFDKTNNKFKSYIGDTNTGWTHDRNFGTYEIATPKMVKEDFENAKIYIGGGMADNATREMGDATIHRVRVYNGTLTVEQIKNLDFVKNANEFENGMAYTFVTERGWMGAKVDNTKAISTAYTANNVTGRADNENFQWAVYKSAKNRYYLYNLGKEMFLGKESNNNTAIPFVSTPTTENLTFKTSGNSNYPIMFSTDNAAVVNHSANHASGLISWTGGWNNLNDGGSNHKVTLVRTLTDAELQTITNLVSAYETGLPFKVEVDGLEANNPNTHFGRITATMGTNVKTTSLTTEHLNMSEVSYNSVGDVIAFTRDYRGFTFQGFYLGEQNLGKSFTLTEAQKNAITEANPLVAKFTTTDDVTLFYDDDPFSYRIPAIATTGTGRIIAVSDYRYSLDDIGRYNFGTQNPGIDLVMRYSDNNGKTWSETKTIAKGSCVRGTDDCAYGDAAIAVVGEKVLVMAAAGDVMFGEGSATAHNRAVRLYSEDNGENWTKQDISETLFINDDATINNGYSSFFGSGRLAVDENYNNTGKPRIYGALLLKKASGTGNYVIYTDDFGLTWSILGGSQNPITNQDEPKVEILPSGQILLSVRRGGGRQFNVFTYTDKSTNEGSWDTNVNGCSNGGSNTCNGEPYCVDAKKADGSSVKLLLQSQPKGGSGLYDRRDVTIWYKEITDAIYTSAQIAADWTQGIQVSTQQSAYSAMALQEDGRIGFFFEEAPCYGDDQAKGYCMVYTPLTIESITKGNYYSPNAELSTVKTINIVLTDDQGNTYRDQVECAINQLATTLTQKYPYIRLGSNANVSEEGETCTYTNTVTLPFKVSNANTTVWHNIYWPANTNENGYPVYLSASAANDTDVPKVTEAYVYGNSSYNTAANADKISWAIYNVGNGFTFKFKNKLTGKFIQVTSVASGNAKNVVYVDEADATAFELVPDAASYRGDYALKASVGESVGYLCSTSATGYHYATHYSGNGHQGAWMKFAEAPDFTALIASINESLGMIGTGLGQYNVDGADAIKAAMENSNTVKQNALNSYKTTLDGATLNLPKVGQFFRIKGISGNYIDATSIYNNATAKSGQMSMKSEETANFAGTIFYLDNNNKLLNYATGTYVYQTREIGEFGTTGGTLTFAESPRGGGKYAIICTTTGGNGQHLHDNSGNRADRCSSNCGDRHDFTLEEVTTLPVTVTEAGYATFYAPVAVEVNGVTTYTVTANGDKATLTEINGGVVPATTGVILKGDEGTYYFAITTTDESIDKGELLGTVAATNVEGEAYVLSAPNGEAGLYKAALTGGVFKNNAFKAYLPASATTSNVKALLFDFGGETTGVDAVEVEKANAPIYDLSGRRVLSTMKGGIYIQNGKKFIVK